MLSEELRTQILHDIRVSDEAVCTTYQKQNKRLLKILIANGIEQAFTNGAIKIPKYKDTVNSILTLFNAYQSGYRYQFTGYMRKQKLTKALLDRLGKVGTIGVVLEGLAKPWELCKLVKSVQLMKTSVGEKPAIKEILSYINQDPNSCVPITTKDTPYYGLGTITEERNKEVKLQVEEEKTRILEPYSSSSSSSDSPF